MGLPPGSGHRPGRGRLSRSAEFDRVFRHGRSHAGRDLVLYVFPRGDDDGTQRIGLSVGRKVGGAVERNRVKRLLREAFARESARLPGGTDAVVVARPRSRDLAEREGLAGIQAALGELIAKVPGATRPESAADAQRETTGDAEGESTSEAKAEATADVKPMSTTILRPESTADVKPESTGSPQPELTADQALDASPQAVPREAPL